jgi:hypothetical protein
VVKWGRQRIQVLSRNKPHAVGDFLETSDFEPLALLDDLDKAGSLHQAGVSAGVQPGHPATNLFDKELVLLELGHADIGDLKLAAYRGLQLVGDCDHIVVVEVEAGNRPV